MHCWKREEMSTYVNKRIVKDILLMVKIRNNHLGCIKPGKHMDKLPTSTGWPDFFHQQYVSNFERPDIANTLNTTLNCLEIFVLRLMCGIYCFHATWWALDACLGGSCDIFQPFPISRSEMATNKTHPLPNVYTPEVQHSPWKGTIPKGRYSSNHYISGDMLVGIIM